MPETSETITFQLPRRTRVLWTPARALFLSFAGLILAGTLALMLPGSRTQPITIIDALFTSTSAVCVTGLVILDTPTFFTRQGQTIIMVLIQCGGLGILTFTTWILMLTGKHLSVFERSTATSSYGILHGLHLNLILRNVFLFTLLFEGAGVALLYCRFNDLFPPAEALFHSLFHSISAFCNAGFSTYPGNLVAFVGDPLINLTIGGLIIFGGLGFVVLSDLWRWLRQGRRTRLTLHSRVALKMTAWLLGGGMALILTLEWDNVLAPLPWSAKLWASFFQSVVPRTAGFNSVDIGVLTAPTLFVMILLMIIGASPGSTGGGIKTTTAAILVALVRSQAFGRSSVEIRERRIPSGDVARALATFAMYMLTLIVGVMLLLIAQSWGRPAVAGQNIFIKSLFECASALGTVGLSMNFSDKLTPLSRLIIIALMFCGRLGPISIALTFVGKSRGGRYEYPEESVMTG